MTEPSVNDTGESDVEDALNQQPMADPDAVAEADQDELPSAAPTNLFTEDDDA